MKENEQLTSYQDIFSNQVEMFSKHEGIINLHFEAQWNVSTERDQFVKYRNYI